MEEPPKFEPVTTQVAESQIGLVRDWLLNKLHNTNDGALVEDDDLPPKQRFPKPRLPPTGKISSPRKRPLREQQQLARKKRKLDEEREENGVLRPPLARRYMEHHIMLGAMPQRQGRP